MIRLRRGGIHSRLRLLTPVPMIDFTFYQLPFALIGIIAAERLLYYFYIKKKQSPLYNRVAFDVVQHIIDGGKAQAGNRVSTAIVKGNAP